MADDTKVDFYFYYHSNHLGSTNFVTRVAKSEDEDKPRHEMYEHVEYIPFGETWIEEREVLPFGASKSNRYLFTSKEFDQETRLYYYGARYYDPKTSLWLSADPILGSYLDGSPNNGVFNHFNLNLYAYTAQNPVNLVDPDGTSIVSKAAKWAGKKWLKSKLKKTVQKRITEKIRNLTNRPGFDKISKFLKEEADSILELYDGGSWGLDDLIDLIPGYGDYRSIKSFKKINKAVSNKLTKLYRKADQISAMYKKSKDVFNRKGAYDKMAMFDKGKFEFTFKSKVPSKDGKGYTQWTKRVGLDRSLNPKTKRLHHDFFSNDGMYGGRSIKVPGPHRHIRNGKRTID